MKETLEKLYFTIELLDRVSGPTKGVCKSIRRLQSAGKDALQLVSRGTVGLIAVGASMLKTTDSAREFSKALGEVASLGVAQEELDLLAKQSKTFAASFGEDATAVARSAYDIQSAIPGLAKGALAAFTIQGNLLAKATKADAATITAFQGTMYNIFEKSANRIGQAKWVEMLTGKTAHAVKIFKTTGRDMSAAFTNLGSIGEKAGVSLDEQLAVLGTLQGTMGGANAGTAYKAFLNTVGRAKLTTKTGETLKFTDESGKLLPMVRILEKIRSAVGPGQLKLADQTRLMQAFGDEGGKAVLNLLDKTESLKDSIGDLSKIQNSNPAVGMAEKMVDPYDRFKQTLEVLKITIGQGLLPVVNSVLSVFSGVMKAIVWALDNVPFLREAVAGFIMIAAGVSSAVAGFYLFRGIAKYMRIFWIELKMTWSWLKALNYAQIRNILIQKLSALWQGICTAATWLYTKAQLAKNAAINAGISGMLLASLMVAKLAVAQKLAAVSSFIMSGGLWTAATAAWAFTAALLANPITWIVAGIVALIGALVALVYYWDEVCAFCVKYQDVLWAMLGPIGWVVLAFRHWDKIVGFLGNVWSAFQSVCPNIAALIETLVRGAWTLIKAPFEWMWNNLKTLGRAFIGLGSAIAYPFRLCYDWIAGKLAAAFELFASLLQRIGGFFSALGSGVKNGILGALRTVDGWIGKILRTVAKVPGLGFLSPDQQNAASKAASVPPAATAAVEVDPKKETASAPLVVPDVVRSRKTRDVPAGGVRSSVTNNTRNYGGVRINVTGGMSPAELDEWLCLQGV